MAITTTTRKVTFIGNGSSTVFPFAFKVFKTSDIEALLENSYGNLTTMALGTDYTAVLNANQDVSPGGSITLTAAPLATGNSLVITSDVQELQEVVLTNLGGFFPDVLNGALDRLTIFSQQLQVAADRSLKFSLTDDSENVDLPPYAQIEGKFLYFGPDGPTASPGIPGPVGPTGPNARGGYSSGTTYAQGDAVVGASGNGYVSLVAGNLNNTPESSSTFWREYVAAGADGPPAQFDGPYNPATSYAEGDQVYASDGSSYISKVGSNVGNNPVSSPTQWWIASKAGTNGEMSAAQTASLVISLGVYGVQRFNPDPTQLNAHFAVNGTTGLLEAFDGFTTSGWVYIGDGSHFICNEASGGSVPYGYALYSDQNVTTYLSGGQFSANTPVATGGANWLLFICEPTTSNLYIGSTAPPSSPQTPFGYQAETIPPIPSLLEISQISQSISTFEVKQAGQPSVNIWDSSTSNATGAWLVGGTLDASTGYWNNTFSVAGITSFTIHVAISGSSAYLIALFFDKDGNQMLADSVAAGLLPTTANQVITVPTGAISVSVAMSNSVLATQMIVAGSAGNMPGSYTPFGITLGSTVAAQVVAIAKSSIPTYGKRMGAWGDSITAGNATGDVVWQYAVAAELGMTITFNDARGGRTTAEAFENYNPSTGISNGGTGVTPNVVGLNFGPSTSGTTLAQDLANVDVMVVFLGMNDGGRTPGTPGDPFSANTLCGDVGNFLTKVHTANPEIRVIYVAPYQANPTSWMTPSIALAVYTAIKGTAELYGDSVIDLLHDSGMNALNESIMMGDNIHPSALGYSTLINPVIAGGIRGRF